METRPNLLYTKDHEWLLVESDQATIGITDHAQNALGAIVFVELPRVGAVLKTGDTLGVAESVKAASDIYTPVSGTVIAVNEALNDTPEAINDSPYENWIARMELSAPDQLNDLMDEDAYRNFCESEAI